MRPARSSGAVSGLAAPTCALFTITRPAPRAAVDRPTRAGLGRERRWRGDRDNLVAVDAEPHRRDQGCGVGARHDGEARRVGHVRSCGSGGGAEQVRRPDEGLMRRLARMAWPRMSARPRPRAHPRACIDGAFAKPGASGSWRGAVLELAARTDVGVEADDRPVAKGAGALLAPPVEEIGGAPASLAAPRILASGGSTIAAGRRAPPQFGGDVRPVRDAGLADRR